MEFTNEFRVPVDVDTTFATMIDLEKVAPCMPGATLEEVDGATYTGRMKVKVGPIQVSYRGTAEVTDIDNDAKRASISASGKEMRGGGTAKAEVTATLREDGGDTVVTVVTDLNVTGKPAQFGRGVMGDVGAKIISTFAERLEAMLREDQAAAAAGEAVADGGTAAGAGEAVADGGTAAGAGAAAGATGRSDGRSAADGTELIATPAATEAPGGPRRIEPDPSREDDALDLVEFAGAATAKRLVPVVVALLVVIGVVWWLRSR